MARTRSGFACTTDILLFRRSPAGLQALLIKRGGEVETGKWAMPGGHVDPEDTYDMGKAAARELQEETGVDVLQEPFPIPLRYAGTRQSPERDWLGHTFWAVVGDHHDLSKLAAADDAAEARWFTWQEVGNMVRAGQMAFDHGEVVEYLFDQVTGMI